MEPNKQCVKKVTRKAEGTGKLKGGGMKFQRQSTDALKSLETWKKKAELSKKQKN